MFWFSLWREFKLSIAEIISVFPEIKLLYISKDVLLVSWINLDEILYSSNHLWWTIKIFELSDLENEEEFYNYLFELWNNTDWKFKYSINLFWSKNFDLARVLKNSKSFLKNKSISARYFNKDDWKNLSSASIIWNSILKKWYDFNIVSTWDNKIYFWKTIWVQDIDAYSSRDYTKLRDMNIGMLPPKLSQIMINLSKINWSKQKESIYDPFCWLWTVLIEGLHIWIKNIFASDFNIDMINATKLNISRTKYIDFIFDIELLDARDIESSNIFKKYNIESIVSEGFLWEIMTKKNISLERINIQRKNLQKLYAKFFYGLKKIKYSWNIVISFPFWNLNWKYIYFEEIYDILNQYCKIYPLLSGDIPFSLNKNNSISYIRNDQLLWREIFKLSLI